MARFLETLRAGARTRFGSWRPEDRAAVARLPVYQVALWPDGWELGRDGSVQVRDTHEMAEARRWYALAEHNHSRDDASRVMTLYGIFVPPLILAMSERHFPSEQVVSVACQLVAGEWIRERRANRLRLQADDGYGLRRCRLLLAALLSGSDLDAAADALAVALIPWNRTVVRDGRPSVLIRVDADSTGP